MWPQLKLRLGLKLSKLHSSTVHFLILPHVGFVPLGANLSLNGTFLWFGPAVLPKWLYFLKEGVFDEKNKGTPLCGWHQSG
jgi:hypothetical protein